MKFAADPPITSAFPRHGAGGRGNYGGRQDLPHFFTIIPEHNLIYVRYSGVVTIEDYVRVVEGVTAHPGFSIEHKHLVDLTHLKRVKREYFKIMLMQARIAEWVARARAEILSVMVAPTPEAMATAKMVLRSWERLDTPVVRRVIPAMEQAASLLGLEDATLRRILDDIDRVAPLD